MIEVNALLDPLSERLETRKTFIVLDHVKAITDKGRGMTLVTFMDGSTMTVLEHVDGVARKLRDYAETAQATRVRAIVLEELDRVLKKAGV